LEQASEIAELITDFKSESRVERDNLDRKTFADNNVRIEIWGGWQNIDWVVVGGACGLQKEHVHGQNLSSLHIESLFEHTYPSLSSLPVWPRIVICHSQLKQHHLSHFKRLFELNLLC
jgi:hypothetical protein